MHCKCPAAFARSELLQDSCECFVAVKLYSASECVHRVLACTNIVISPGCLRTRRCSATALACRPSQVPASDVQSRCQGEWLDSPGVAPKAATLLFALTTLAMAAAWIQLIAGELVGCLRACGTLLRCPPVLLGFTLAIVNSLGDQATNTAVARVSGARAAFAACFSGQTFNVAMASLLGYWLNRAHTHARVVQLRVSPSTWLLWGVLAVYLVVLLVAIGVLRMRQGSAEVPARAGTGAQALFGLLLASFWLVGLCKWIL